MGDGDGRARGPQAPAPSQSLDFALCKMEAFLRTDILPPFPGLGDTSWCSRTLLPERFPRTPAPRACGNEQSGERGCWEVDPCRGSRSLVQGSRSSQECGDGVSEPLPPTWGRSPRKGTLQEQRLWHRFLQKRQQMLFPEASAFILTRVSPANPQPLGTRTSGACPCSR